MTTTSEGELSARGGRWAVATPHRDASGAAADVLRAGGNAVDAALAAATILTVVYPNQCSVGGDLLALVGTADGAIRFVNSSGRAPRAVDVSAVRRHYDVMPVGGALPVTVPGVVAGWAVLAATWGTRPLASALAPAEAAARDGVAVAPGLARDLRREADLLARDAGARDVFFPSGALLTAGQVLRQPALARTFRTLAETGSDALYGGELGADLVGFLRGRGSAMTLADLGEHAADVAESYGVTYDGLEYLSSADNSQGLYFLLGLKVLEDIRTARGPVDPLGRDAGVVASVLARAAADRDRQCADPRSAPSPVEALLADEYTRRVAADVLNGEPIGPVAQRKVSGDTVAIVTADSSGNWVSLIQSVFHCFGTGLIEPRSGILLHNRGASFSLDPRSPNTLAGGKRPMHTLMPVLVRAGTEIVGAHGAMGGRAQPQVHTHIALQLAAGASIERAVSAPRWVLGAMEAGVVDGAGLVTAEEDVPAFGVQALRAAGFGVQGANPHDDAAGHGQVVRRELSGAVPRLSAATDPRADGAALAG